ncbi:hypothetical protein HanOQP8_Chr05g0177171 [Helianthus annuus]|nr:hypothetical protein HanOQP8_Chr05g0177171 [Helianthus annuus]
MSSDKQQSKPPPVIGKIGYYTVFVTPTAKPSPEPSPVQPPPVHYDKTAASYGSKFGFFWDAIATLQNVHSSLDDYLAHWFGLNQSKYQWALDDYYEHESTVLCKCTFRNLLGTSMCRKVRKRELSLVVPD